jgi:hypothetical protein
MEKLYFVSYYNEWYVIADAPSWKTSNGYSCISYDDATDSQIRIDSYDGSYIEEAEDVSYTLLLDYEDEKLVVDNLDNEHLCKVLWVYYVATGKGWSWAMPLSQVLNNYI